MQFLNCWRKLNMFHYNFTNDLRISNLDTILKESANAFLTDTVPPATIDKSKNNNFMTLGFYFNLKAKGNCAKLAASGNIKKVVLNFIKKFQFPNVRTSSDYENSISDKILLAPMRDIVKLLHILSMISYNDAFLTKDEIINFIFYNEDLAKRKNYNLLNTANQILQYRKDHKIPANVDTTESNHIWNQPERQIREMLKTVNYTGCFLEDENGIKLKSDGITRDNEADLFEIINCNSYWTGETLEDYQKYMDEIFMNDEDDKNILQNISSNSYTPNSSQTIYYGVPGCGKSNKIDEETINTSDEQKMRVVFHPEYTNADFVGQILPTNVDGNVEYKFRPGPLSKILRRAYLHPDKKYYLIVEEINRGNAAAIFGEYFQLLDRIAAKKEVPANGYTYTEGWSRYSIENEFINWYIRENLYADVNHKLQNEDDGIAKKSDDESQKAIEIGNLHFSANTGIRLPPNLSILATMNTSDQNVFILDNAFQRRWDMVLVKNEFGDDSENQKLATIENSDITWETFQKTINEKISQFSKENNFSSMIDKRLGCWFVKAVPDKNDANGKYIITEDSFKNKILKYLWDDAFKFCHEDVFEDADNFEALLEKVKMDNPDFGVFKNVDFSAEKSEKSESQHEI